MNNSLSFVNDPQPRNRSTVLIDEFLTRYKIAKHQYKEANNGKTVNAICFLGGAQFEVRQLRDIPPDMIDVTAKAGDAWIALIAPVEQFSFGFIETEVQLETPAAEIPPAEIGFAKTPAAKDLPFFGKGAGVTL